MMDMETLLPEEEEEILRTPEAFREHPMTRRVAVADGTGEIWLFRDEVPYFLPYRKEDIAQRISPSAALRAITERGYRVVDGRAYSQLVKQLGKHATSLK